MAIPTVGTATSAQTLSAWEERLAAGGLDARAVEGLAQDLVRLPPAEAAKLTAEVWAKVATRPALADRLDDATLAAMAASLNHYFGTLATQAPRTAPELGRLMRLGFTEALVEYHFCDAGVRDMQSRGEKVTPSILRQMESQQRDAFSMRAARINAYFDQQGRALQAFFQHTNVDPSRLSYARQAETIDRKGLLAQTEALVGAYLYHQRSAQTARGEAGQRAISPAATQGADPAAGSRTTNAPWKVAADAAIAAGRAGQLSAAEIDPLVGLIAAQPVMAVVALPNLLPKLGASGSLQVVRAILKLPDEVLARIAPIGLAPMLAELEAEARRRDPKQAEAFAAAGRDALAAQVGATPGGASSPEELADLERLAKEQPARILDAAARLGHDPRDLAEEAWVLERTKELATEPSTELVARLRRLQS